MKNKTFYDVNNGENSPWTFDEIVNACKINPTWAKDKPIFFDADNVGYTLEDFAEEAGLDVVWDSGLDVIWDGYSYYLVEKGN